MCVWWGGGQLPEFGCTPLRLFCGIIVASSHVHSGAGTCDPHPRGEQRRPAARSKHHAQGLWQLRVPRLRADLGGGGNGDRPTTGLYLIIAVWSPHGYRRLVCPRPFTPTPTPFCPSFPCLATCAQRLNLVPLAQHGRTEPPQVSSLLAMSTPVELGDSFACSDLGALATSSSSALSSSSSGSSSSSSLSFTLAGPGLRGRQRAAADLFREIAAALPRELLYQVVRTHVGSELYGESPGSVGSVDPSPVRWWRVI